MRDSSAQRNSAGAGYAETLMGPGVEGLSKPGAGVMERPHHGAADPCLSPTHALPLSPVYPGAFIDRNSIQM